LSLRDVVGSDADRVHSSRSMSMQRSAGWPAIVLVVVSAIGLNRCAGAERQGERKFLLERIDDAAVVQPYADGVAKLPLKEKLLTCPLYQAALGGRDIYYDQRFAHSLEMRSILEAIIPHPEGVDPDTLAEIRRYTKLFWLNNGPYNHLTARKFVLKC